ncbi:MAG: DUF3793 family protein [Lachnospiraceae bacterium]|nr:DUF3793 family protein [Lachnospiraceae bacterium]
MSEELIIEHCSPTLAGIKTGSLFSVRVTEDTDINKEVRDLNKILRKKGIRIIPLKKTDKYALIYLYRPEHLKKDFNDPQTLSILKKKGYEPQNPECCIAQLIKRLERGDVFPHEIGLFLGYPPSDVECFMKHPCKGVKCCGCWKVYSEPERAKNTFKRFRTCTEAYHQMNKNGKTLAQLAVMTKVSGNYK